MRKIGVIKKKMFSELKPIEEASSEKGVYKQNNNELFKRVSPNVQLLMLTIQNTNYHDQLSKLRLQTKLCHALRQTLEGKFDNHSDEDILEAKEYILLPLTLVVQTLHHQYYEEETSHPTPNIAKVMDSAMFNCIAEIAQTMACWIKLVCRASTNNGQCAAKNQRDQTSMSTKCMMTCHLCWSLLDRPGMENDGRLDKGEDAMEAILRTMQVIFENLDDKFVTDMTNGDWMAKTISYCLVNLELDKSQIVMDSLMMKKSNIPLQLQSLDSLHSMLVHMPFKEIWRKVFPGCFAVSSTCIQF